jgi:transporter family-2 protein
VALSLGAGVLVAVQARMNGGLAELLDSVSVAALVSFASGLVILTVVMVLWPPMFAGIKRLPTVVRTGQLRNWQLFAGLAGAIFVWSQSRIVPVAGTAIFLLGVTAGVSLGSLIVDRLGVSAMGKQAVTWQRVAAAVITVFAVWISVVGRGDDAVGVGALALIAFAVGVLSAGQQAVNSQIGKQIGEPLSATWLNFFVGTAGLVALIGVNQVLSLSESNGALWRSARAFEVSDIWLLFGGLAGVGYITASIIAVRGLGVLGFSLFLIVGQMSIGLLLDLLVPTGGASVGAYLVIGVALTLLAATLTLQKPHKQ